MIQLKGYQHKGPRRYLSDTTVSLFAHVDMCNTSPK